MNSERSSLRCSAQQKISADNPLMQPAGAGGRRSFLVLDEGEEDGALGYWAEDADDGAEG